MAALSLIAAMPPDEVARLLRHRLDQLGRSRAEVRDLIGTALGRGVPGLFLVEEEYRLALLAAETAFVEEFLGKITDPATGWGPVWAEFHGQPASSQAAPSPQAPDPQAPSPQGAAPSRQSP